MKKKDSNDAGATSKRARHYKLWVLAAIVLLALCSLFTRFVTLRWSAAGNLNQLDSMILEDLDVLEVEERVKVVKHMWDVYNTHSHGNSIPLPQFWSQAFEAAYEHLVSDVPAVRDAAVSEIAKMSLALRSHISHQLQSQSHVERSNRRSRKMKQAESSKDNTVDSSQQ